MMKIKTSFIFLLSAICLTFLCNYKVIAKEDIYIQAKLDSYKALAEAYYNNNIYKKYRAEVIETIGKLVDKSDKLYLEENKEKAELYKRLNSMFSLLTNAKKTLPSEQIKSTPINKEEKLKEIELSGNAALAYILKDALSSDEYNIRINAAEYIAYIDEESAAPIFLELLKDENDNNKVIAINTLSRLKNKDAVPIIISCLNSTTNKTVKQSAINALSNIRTAEAIDAIIKYTSDNDDSIKLLAIASLITENDSKYKDMFITMLQDTNLEEKVVPLLVMIIDRNQEKSLDLVQIALKSQNKSTRLIGLGSLIKLSDKQKAIEIFNMVSQDQSDDIKMLTVKLLSDFKNPKVLSIIKSIKFNSDIHRYKALQVILSSKNIFLEPYLEDIFSTSDIKMKIAIANYFFEKNPKNSLYADFLKSLLSNNSEESKYIAASILYQHGYKESKPVLEEMLNSENPFLKVRAIVLCSEKRDNIVQPLLEDFVNKNKDYKKNYGPSLILYNLGNDNYLNNLIDYLSQTDLEPISQEIINKELFKTFLSHNNDLVKLNAAQSLYNSGEKGCLDNIRNLINSKELKVRVKVVKILGKYGDKTDIDSLHKLVKDDYVRIRVNASEAILRILNREEKASRS